MSVSWYDIMRWIREMSRSYRKKLSRLSEIHLIRFGKMLRNKTKQTREAQLVCEKLHPVPDFLYVDQ